MVSIKFKKLPKGPERKKTTNKSKTNPNCSKSTIVSDLTGIIENKILEPSKGGIGIKLKKARITFQKTIIIKNTKAIAPTEPEIT